MAVFYIAHGAYGIEPIARFAASYLRYTAGAGHKLIVAPKQLDDAQKESVRDALGGIEYREVDVPTDGYDIGTYLHLSKVVTADYYALFNTNAAVLADDWLAKLLTAFDDPGVGLAGASGSWQSLAGYERRFRRGPPVPRWLSGLRMTLRYWRALRRFPRFPNPHLRTTALVVPAKVMHRVAHRRIRTRVDATAFESGRAGLTRTVARMGLRAVVVDRLGGIHEQDAWSRSGTFRQDAQQMLLAADNRTRDYQEADSAERARLSDFSWAYP